MSIPTKEDIDMMDKLFLSQYNNSSHLNNEGHLTTLFNIDNEYYTYIQNRICYQGFKLELLKEELATDLNHRIFEFNKIECDRFIGNGCFETYFKKMNPKKNWFKENYVNVIVIPLVGFILMILGYYIKVQIDKDQRQTIREETYQLLKKSIQSNLKSRH